MFNKHQHKYKKNNRYNGVNTIAHNDHNTEVKIQVLIHLIHII